jgi:hypothetical protein
MPNLEAGRRTVRVVRDGEGVATDDAVTWAIEELTTQLASAGVGSTEPGGPNTPAAVTVRVVAPSAAAGRAGDAEVPTAPESYLLIREGDEVVVTGSDATGIVYALLELAARVTNAEDPITTLLATTTESGAPAVPVRGIVRSFSSVDEDTPWFHDRVFWTE